MLSVILVAALNTFGHVYSTHRHEEVTRTTNEKLWSHLQYKSAQNSLTQIKVPCSVLKQACVCYIVFVMQIC